MTTDERPVRVEINCETGEQIITSLTDAEIAQQKEDQKRIAEENAVLEAQEKTKAAAKASALAKLTALGLTEDEAKAIAG